MRQFYFQLIALGILFSFALLVTTISPERARAVNANELQAQIDAHNAEIAQLQADIAKYQKELDALGSKKTTLQSAISSLAISQKQLASQISITQNKIDSANLKIQELTLSIGDKEETISSDQNAIGKMLRDVAQTDSTPLVAQMLTSTSLSDAWKVTDEAIQLNKNLGDHITELQNVKTALSSNRDEVSTEKAKLVSLANDLATQKKSIDINKTAQEKLLTDTKNQESAYQKIITEKKAEEANFEATLFDLQSQLKYVLDPSHIPPAGKGVLHWPLDNIFITQQFGQTSSSGRLYASGTHNGVDFRASIGTPVHAALTGIVLDVNYGAVSYCQYGKWVMIKHNNGLTTLYAHLSDIAVQKGQAVTTGQVIGYSGDTGYAIGPHLHVSLFVSDAVSFKQYTCKSGYSVKIPIAPVNAYLDPLAYF